MLNFFQYNEQLETPAILIFGRFQGGPHIGHLSLIQTVSDIAKGQNGNGFIFISPKFGDKKNPLSYKERLNIFKSISPWPENVKIVENQNIKAPIEAIEHLAKRGFKHIVLVAGSDRQAEYQRYEKYTREYGATSYSVITIGHRDSDSKDEISSISGTKMRQAVIDDNFETFSKMFASKNKQVIKQTYETLKLRLKK